MMGDMNKDTFDQWESDAREVWARLAPSYVQHDVQVLRSHLRDLYEAGASIAQFEEALEVAFASKNVTKRRALYYAFGVVRRLIQEETDGG